MIISMVELQHYWSLLSNVPVDDEECIEETFLHFEKGSCREDIWSWFEAQNPEFSVYDVMFPNN